MPKCGGKIILVCNVYNTNYHLEKLAVKWIQLNFTLFCGIPPIQDQLLLIIIIMNRQYHILSELYLEGIISLDC